MTKPSKEVEKIEQWLADPWTVDIEELWQQAADNPDHARTNGSSLTLYTLYVLDKRQDDIIERKDFVI
ncbi:hypothetical protein QY896_18085 [Lactiplantibacillus plantarum]